MALIGILSVVMGAAFIWLLYGLYDSDARRILTLLDIGLIIATGDIIAKVTWWIDVQSGLIPAALPDDRFGWFAALPRCPALDARAFKAVIDRPKPRRPTPRLFQRGRW
jgi:hypothetical protein